MTLRDLGAYFVRYTEYPSARAGNPPVRGCCLEANPERAQGISLLCPACYGEFNKHDEARAHRLLLWFRGTGVPHEAGPPERFDVDGTGLDDLSIGTINDPIDVHWRGVVRSGVVVDIR